MKGLFVIFAAFAFHTDAVACMFAQIEPCGPDEPKTMVSTRSLRGLEAALNRTKDTYVSIDKKYPYNPQPNEYGIAAGQDSCYDSRLSGHYAFMTLDAIKQSPGGSKKLVCNRVLEGFYGAVDNYTDPKGHPLKDLLDRVGPRLDSHLKTRADVLRAHAKRFTPDTIVASLELKKTFREINETCPYYAFNGCPGSSKGELCAAPAVFTGINEDGQLEGLFAGNKKYLVCLKQTCDKRLDASHETCQQVSAAYSSENKNYVAGRFRNRNLPALQPTRTPASVRRSIRGTGAQTAGEGGYSPFLIPYTP